MKGDFTRWTFDPTDQFTRVLAQQGRVQLDADWNEQVAILLHYMRALAEDLIGPFGTPAKADGTAGEGFLLVAGKGEYLLRPGRYYVGGILVESRAEEKSGGKILPPVPKAGTYLLYLDVWESLVTYVQNDRIREVALGGGDTAVRAQVVWQVRAQDADPKATRDTVLRDWPLTVEKLQPANRGQLKAQAQRGQSDDDLCIVSPDARYSGENQLYRVEIHRGGTVAEGATFKWSRENGSVVFPITNLERLTLDNLGREGRLSLEAGVWVEALDDNSDGSESPRALLKVKEVDADRSRVVLDGSPSLDPQKHPFLRRWDQRERGKDDLKEGTVPVREGQWVELEDGVNVWFEPAATGTVHRYRPGDYWLIPARTATGDVEWPLLPDQSGPKPVAPQGVEHRYAPLGILKITGKDDNPQVEVVDCRTIFGTRAEAKAETIKPIKPATPTKGTAKPPTK